MRYLCNVILAIIILIIFNFVVHLTQGVNTEEHTLLYFLEGAVAFLVAAEALRNINFK